MINNPESEQYYSRLLSLGYLPFNYSEKHYLFSKNDRIIKIARSIYNNATTDESYYIEAQAHKILSLNGLAVAEICRIFEKGEMVDDFIVLEEEKVSGDVYYRKNSKESVLKQILDYMLKATVIQGKSFGMLDKNGEAHFASWQGYLVSVITRAPEKDRERLLCELECVPKDVIPSFVITDCNTANFIFESDKLKCAIDIERPMWGDRDFLFGVIKARNPFLFDVAIKAGYAKNVRLISIYEELYKYIFDKCE